MTATRTLDRDGLSFELVQSVHLPDGTSPSNKGTYVREDLPDGDTATTADHE